MEPWDYEEMQHCKAILYPNEEILPTTLMDRLIDWYGGVPRYVLELASARFKALDGNEDAVLQELVGKVNLELNQRSPIDFFKSLQVAEIDGNYPHLVIHIRRHPSGNLDQFDLRWASHEVRSVMEEVVHQELRSGSSCGKMLLGIMSGSS
jgi:predicted metallopeptidase